MKFTLNTLDPIDGSTVKGTQVLEIPGPSVWEIAYQWLYYVAQAVEIQTSPEYIAPGNNQLMKDALGGALRARADGAVFRNGKRLGNATVDLLMSFGDGVFGRSKNKHTWYEWLGDKWVALSVANAPATAPVELDPDVFTAYPALPAGMTPPAA